MSSLLITHADVLQTQPRQTTVLADHDILIRDRVIEAIQPTGQADASHFDQVIDARRMLAMPGLINTHSHVPMVLWRGLAEDVTIESWFNDYIWQLESNLQSDDVYWGMLLGLAEMIEAGVTSVADHYFYMDEAARAVETAGTRALLGWAIFSSNGMQQIPQTAAFVERWQNAADGRIRAWLAPHAPYTCDDDFLRACAQQAQKLNVGIHIHASENMAQTEASLSKRGITPIQVLEQTGILENRTILAHVCGALDADIALLSRYQTGVAHAPKTYLKLAMDITPVLKFRAAGIPVGLATDGAVSNNTLDVWESLRLMALMQKDRAGNPELMTIAEALYIATQESATVYGMGEQLGALAPNRLADLILVDLSGVHHQPLYNHGASLVYNLKSSDVQTVIVNGKVLMRDRVLTTINKAEVIAHIRANMERLSQRKSEQKIQDYNP